MLGIVRLWLSLVSVSFAGLVIPVWCVQVCADRAGLKQPVSCVDLSALLLLLTLPPGQILQSDSLSG